MAHKRAKQAPAQMRNAPPVNTYRTGPDADGHFGIHGGRFVAETLMPLILAVEEAYQAAKKDPTFAAELDDPFKHYGGRPSPLYHAKRLTGHSAARKSISSAMNRVPVPDGR